MTKNVASYEWDAKYTMAGLDFLSDGFADNFYEGRPLLQFLRGKGIKRGGAPKIIERVNMGSTAKGGSGAKGKRFDITDVDPFTAAEFSWAYYFEPIVVYEQDRHENQGPTQMIGLVGEKTNDAGERQRDQISNHLCASTKAASTDVNTLLECVDQTGEFGGLNPATAGQEPWAAVAETSTITFSTGGMTAMRQMSQNVSAGGRYGHDLTLLDKTRFEVYVDIAEDTMIQNTNASTRTGVKVADMGFSTQVASFDNRPLMWDPDWTTLQNGKGLMLNTDGVRLIESSSHAFSLHQFESTWADGVPASVGWLMWYGQFTCRNRRQQGVFDDLTG